MGILREMVRRLYNFYTKHRVHCRVHSTHLITLRNRMSRISGDAWPEIRDIAPNAWSVVDRVKIQDGG